MILKSVLYWVSVSCLGLNVSAAHSAQVAAAPAGEVIVAGAAACRVQDRSPATAPSGGAGQLMAICGEAGVVLGPATTYTAISNVAQGSVLVVMTRAGRTRVLLASPAAGGAAVEVDDLTRTLARLEGRAAEVGLGDAVVDTTRFALDATVGLKGVPSRLDLTSYFAHALATTTTTASSK